MYTKKAANWQLFLWAEEGGNFRNGSSAGSRS